jgi:hypothetical protein
MTTVNRAYSLAINANLPGGRNSLLKDSTDSNPISEKPYLMCGDSVPLRLYFRIPVLGANSTTAELEAGSVIVLCGTLAETPYTNLFVVSGFALSSEYYTADINLNVAPVIAALATASTIDVSIDIEVRNATNTARITYRADVVLCKEGFNSDTVSTSLAVVASPDGSIWQVGVTNEGQPTCLSVAPETPLVAAPLVASADGSLWQLSVTNDGQPQWMKIA